MAIQLQEVDKVEILTLQDNFIDIAAHDGTAIVQGLAPEDAAGNRVSILAEHGFSAVVSLTVADRNRLLLIIAQPDLGTAMTFAAIVGGAFILAGLRRKTIVLLVVAALLIGIGGWNVALKDYQKQRVMTLINPQGDPRGSGYQVIQSKIAIGSGGFSGTGFMKGTQSQLRFLPARHTDFIFSVIGEEVGFLGVFVVLALYLAMLTRMFLSVGKARDRAGVYIIFTASLLIAFQFLVNVLLIIGLFHRQAAGPSPGAGLT